MLGRSTDSRSQFAPQAGDGDPALLSPRTKDAVELGQCCTAGTFGQQRQRDHDA
jgi:hypothetical protein